jgi:DNA-directed RNA polymerase specialized sigma subunit
MPSTPNDMIKNWKPEGVDSLPLSTASSSLFKTPKVIPTPQPVGPYYLEQNYEPHYNAWKTDPTPENTGTLLKVVDPVIREALRTYGGGSSASPTLRSKARLLATKAIDVYDPSKAKLRTHLLSYMQGLRRMSAKEDQILNVPEQVLLDMGGLREAENELRDRLSRDPSDLELADHTGLSRKRIGYLRLMKPSFAEGKLMEVDEEGSGMSDPSVRQISNNEGLRAWHEFVYHDLDPIDQQIMEHTLGLHNKRVLSNQEVAKKLKLSPGAISQRKARIQSKLDMSADTGLSI